MQPFVERASEHGLYLLSKAFGVVGAGVRFKSLARLPDFNDREVIQSPILNEKLEANHTLVLLAVGGKFPE